MKSVVHKYALLICSSFLMVTLASCNAAPGLTVNGRLIDKDGKPVASIQVMLGKFRDFIDLYHAFSIPSFGGNPHASTTDENGVFQIESADPGAYLLLYRGETDEGDSVLHALTDKQGRVIVLELSETEGASVGTISILNYPKLPKNYLPDFLSSVSLGMSLNDFEALIPTASQTVETEDHIYRDEIEQAQGVSKVVYGFDKESNQLDDLEIWYTEDTSAYNFGEETFGIPNYQGDSVDGGSVIYWRFDLGDSQVVVTARRGRLEFQVQD